MPNCVEESPNVEGSGEPMTKREKKDFLLFTRVLLLYLERKDPPLHKKVEDIIRECTDSSGNMDAVSGSKTAAIKARLKEVVCEEYWTRAESYYLSKVPDLQMRRNAEPPKEITAILRK